jgi:hypothetical protein
MNTSTIEADVKLEPADLMVLHRCVARRSKAQLINLVLLLVSFLVAAMAASHFIRAVDILPSIYVLYGGLALYIVLRLAFKDVLYKKVYGNNSYAFDARRYVFSAQGLRITAPHTESAAAWPAISRIEKLKAHIILFLPGETQGYIIPFRCLPQTAKPDDAAKQLETWRSQYKAG